MSVCNNGEWYKFENRIKKLFVALYDNKCSLNEVIVEIIKRDWKEEDIIFSIGLEYDNTFAFFSENTTWLANIPLRKDGYERIKEIERIFIDNCNGDCSIRYFRCLGCWNNQQGKENKIYYFWAVNNCNLVHMMYFKSIEKVYCQLIYKQLKYVLDAIEELQNPLYKFPAVKTIVNEISFSFQEEMLNLFNIDLSVIIDLSGSYYEGQQCCSSLVFSFEEPVMENTIGISFIEPFEVCTQNIRRIRKVLEMGKEESHLMAVWNEEQQKWMITGLYLGSGQSQTNFVFKVIKHMKWNMEIDNKRVICYDCGKYKIECTEFQVVNFSDKYLKTFGQTPPEYVHKFFVKAIEQTHGTMLVILGKNKIADEVNRLLSNSVGIGIVDTLINEQIIRGVTSIDGAVVMDSDGMSYGIGMILDSSEKIEGRKPVERGSRYTAALKYIIHCKNNEIPAVAVVVSEDRTVNIISTKDDLST